MPLPRKITSFQEKVSPKSWKAQGVFLHVCVQSFCGFLGKLPEKFGNFPPFFPWVPPFCEHYLYNIA